MRAAVSSTPSLSSIETATPICASRLSMVVTSRRCGTLKTVSGSAVSSAAVRIGSVAFLAPETATSPASCTPPSMTSLSMLFTTGGSPFLGRIGLHGERVNLRAHAPAQRRVHLLVLLHARAAAERVTHDHRLEMVPVALHRHVLARQSLADPAFDLSGINHGSLRFARRTRGVESRITH